MRAISLWQPWASAFAIGAKRNETRHWPTNYRGTFVIHAASRKNVGELIYLTCHWNWCGALASLGARMGGDWSMHTHLPFGALLGTVDLIDCRPTESLTQGELDEMRYSEADTAKLYGWKERQMGNYDLGRFAWITENPRPFPEPIPYKGKQGWFNVDDELITAAASGVRVEVPSFAAAG